jgi:LysR family transcriptional activator of nhaA
MRKFDRAPGFPECLRGVPLFLPARQEPLREQFELLMAGAGIVPEVRAEVDDMALLRLLALSGKGLALTSAIVVERELDAARLAQVLPLPGLSVRFHAVTVRRRLGNPWIEEVVAGIRGRIERFIGMAQPARTDRPGPSISAASPRRPRRPAPRPRRR